jgi:hydrogenase expression/formation protein HypD
MPCVIIGFEPLDILQGILMLLNQLIDNNPQVEVQYSRIVKRQGNATALRLLSEVFVETDSIWRGLGTVPKSGFAVSKAYSAYDANNLFQIDIPDSQEPKGCICGDVLKGKREPYQCGLFRSKCAPSSPVGPCMVSQEGACSAYYKYGDI